MEPQAPKPWYADIPNYMTLANLGCGVLALLFIREGNLQGASWLMLLAAGLDFLDGFTARLLKVSSALGAQLDSLADLVTFGVVPGFIIHAMMNNYGYCPAEGFCINTYVFMLIPLFSAWRLANFNIDTRQREGFLGVPTPANGLLIASFPFIAGSGFWLDAIITDFYFLKFFPLVAGFLLVSDMPLMAFKFKSFGLKDNVFRYLFLLGMLLLLLIWGWKAVPLVFAGYLLISLLHYAANRKGKALQEQEKD
jgi:CDP-diacylglycerol--serine O-phosphatidyltransferase